MLVLTSVVSTMLVLTEADIFSVRSYGAVGNGITDDTLAFTKAWNETCNSNNPKATMVIPKEKIYLVLPSNFSGPCISKNITVEIHGTILAPKEPKTWKGLDVGRWLAFKNIDGLVVSGVGILDGRGKGWWSVSCRYHPGPGCVTRAPTAISFTDCNNVKMSDINMLNSPQSHILVDNTNNVLFERLHISSPGDSPNTDGIHINRSKNITIQNAIIKSGDDCISIGDYSSNINISYIECGPGHGIRSIFHYLNLTDPLTSVIVHLVQVCVLIFIGYFVMMTSIGSLGKGGNEVQVEGIRVQNVHFIGTTNGARIKTWTVGKGSVRDITYLNLNFTNVQNPIVIDQNYCSEGCRLAPNKEAGVHISDVSYTNFLGTSQTQAAITFNCSETVPCTDIKLENVQLKPHKKGKKVVSRCNNAHGDASGHIQPESCLDE